MYSVLIVEDDPSVREALKLIVEAEGHEVIEAADGETALEALKDDLPDVMLLDYRLPVMDGIELLEMIRADSDMADLPVIMVTAKGAPKDRHAAMKLGVLDYINKPWAEGEIELRLRWAIRAGSIVPAAPWELTGALKVTSPPAVSAKTGADSPTASKDWSSLSLPEGSGMDIVSPEKGGHVESEDSSVQVTVPEGAVRRSMALSISPGDDSASPHPASLRVKLGDSVSDLMFSDRTGIPVESPRLDKPIEIAINYESDLVAEVGGAPEVEEYDDQTGLWSRRPTEIDSANRVARISVERFPLPVAYREGGKILTITDDEVQQELLDEALVAAGYKVHLVAKTEQILNAIKAERPHVVVLDVAFRQNSGFKILRQLKNNPATSRVAIIVLGEEVLPGGKNNPGQNDYADAMSIGARDMIAKPWHPGDLQMRVARAFDALMARKNRADGPNDREAAPKPVEIPAKIEEKPDVSPVSDLPVNDDVDWERVGQLTRGWKPFRPQPFRPNEASEISSDRGQ